MRLQRMAILYFCGSLGAALVVTTFWMLSKFFSQWGFLMRSISLEHFYGPTMLGGLAALLLLVPTRMSFGLQVMLTSVVASVLHVSMVHNWLNVRFFALFNLTTLLQRSELSLLLLYLIVWSGTVLWVLRRQGV